ncbi:MULTISPECIES: hypothetical protein [Streptomyces]|uniref:hypothetical protein n=1 Tax=Streptomyces TaxID=1883 RepID=UPI002476173F|nr:hypothetical protein [Streptomyces sp. SAI-119]MDH6449624.1 hypothetical protein [Streptomyces sp. SAI-119]
MTRTIRLAAVSAVAALLLAACGELPQGPAGRVIDKDTDYQPATKTSDYFLTVRTPEGEEDEFEVSSDDYDRCYRGSAYPGCIKRTDRG